MDRLLNGPRIEFSPRSFHKRIEQRSNVPAKRVSEALGVSGKTVLEKSVENADDLSSCYQELAGDEARALMELDFGIS